MVAKVNKNHIYDLAYNFCLGHQHLTNFEPEEFAELIVALAEQVSDSKRHEHWLSVYHWKEAPAIQSFLDGQFRNALGDLATGQEIKAYSMIQKPPLWLRLWNSFQSTFSPYQ